MANVYSDSWTAPIIYQKQQTYVQLSPPSPPPHTNHPIAVLFFIFYIYARGILNVRENVWFTTKTNDAQRVVIKKRKIDLILTLRGHKALLGRLTL